MGSWNNVYNIADKVLHDFNNFFDFVFPSFDSFWNAFRENLYGEKSTTVFKSFWWKQYIQVVVWANFYLFLGFQLHA